MLLAAIAERQEQHRAGRPLATASPTIPVSRRAKPPWFLWEPNTIRSQLGMGIRYDGLGPPATVITYRRHYRREDDAYINVEEKREVSRT